MDTQSLITTRNTLAAWNRGGTNPFAGVNSVHAYDRSQDALGQASAVLSVLSAACSDAERIARTGKTSEFQSVSPQVLASALDGLGTLVDFANFLLEE